MRYYAQRDRILNKRAVILALAALLLLTVPAFALADENTTQAHISFTDGTLEIGDITSGSGMEFQFGPRPLPSIETTYPTINTTSHVLSVEDSRLVSGDWRMMVEMTEFTGSSSSFLGVVTLENPSVSNENTSAGTTGLSVVSTISVASEGGEALVMTADATLPRGVFSATWTQENVNLTISDTEVLNVKTESYTATLTWMLTVGP